MHCGLTSLVSASEVQPWSSGKSTSASPSLSVPSEHIVAVRWRMNTSPLPFVSPGTRFVPKKLKRTRLPSGLIVASTLRPFACPPAALTLTRSVVPVWRSWANTSTSPLVSPVTRLVAKEEKATWRPSALIDGMKLMSFDSPPPVATLTRSVVSAWRSRTKMSASSLVSPDTRFDAVDSKAT